MNPISDPGKEARAASGLPVIPALDGFRAFAILGIVFMHLTGVSQVDHVGPQGVLLGFLPSLVDILFILSGFVVFLPTVARGGDFGSVRAYAIRRAARLLPAYWLAIAIVLLMLAIWPGTAPASPGVYDVGIHISGMQTWFHQFDTSFSYGLGVDLPLWTLTLELTFYFILPFIAAAYFRHPLIGLLIGAAITIAWKLAALHIGQIADLAGFDPSLNRLLVARFATGSQFPAFAFDFAIGMTSAWLYVRARELRPREWLERWAGIAQLLSLAGLLVTGYLFGRPGNTTFAIDLTLRREDIILNLALVASFAGLMLSTALAPKRRQIPFALPFARSLGDISYGIYLIHLPILLFLIGEFGTSSLLASMGTFWFLLVFGVPVIVLYGWASARWLEQPLRRRARRFGRGAEVERRPALPVVET